MKLSKQEYISHHTHFLRNIRPRQVVATEIQTIHIFRTKQTSLFPPEQKSWSQR